MGEILKYSNNDEGRQRSQNGRYGSRYNPATGKIERSNPKPVAKPKGAGDWWIEAVTKAVNTGSLSKNGGGKRRNEPKERKPLTLEQIHTMSFPSLRARHEAINKAYEGWDKEMQRLRNQAAVKAGYKSWAEAWGKNQTTQAQGRILKPVLKQLAQASNNMNKLINYSED